MVVVAVVGILASLSSYGVRKYTAAAKSAEAVNAVGNMGMAVRIAADREIMSSAVLALGQTSTQGSTTTTAADTKVTGSASGKGKGKGSGGATVTHEPSLAPGLCASSEPVPKSINSVKGRKYQPSATDYQTGDTRTGWRCLLFSVEQAQYYRYQYRGGGGAPVSVKLPHGGTPKGLTAGHLWTASAQGDLDGDGETSWFVLNGYIQTDGHIVTAPAIGTDRPGE
jgi:type IV pilus assembly protein PilA